MAGSKDNVPGVKLLSDIIFYYSRQSLPQAAFLHLLLLLYGSALLSGSFTFATVSVFYHTMA